MRINLVSSICDIYTENLSHNLEKLSKSKCKKHMKLSKKLLQGEGCLVGSFSISFLYLTEKGGLPTYGKFHIFFAFTF